MKHHKDIAVLIPAFNASLSLRAVLEGAKSHGFHVLTVDDGSTDSTSEIAEELGVQVIRHQVNRGKGMALQTGFRILFYQGFQAIITMDADGQHDPSCLPQFVQAYHKSRGDIIIGSRTAEFGQMSWLRRFWNRLGVKAVSKLTGTSFTDTQSGYRLIKKEVLRGLPLCASGYEGELELLIKACKRGCTVVDIPITTQYADGRPSSHFRPVSDTWLICRTFLQELFWRYNGYLP